MDRLTIYSPMMSNKSCEMPIGPYLCIAVGHGNIVKENGEHVLLSAELYSEGEIDGAVEELQKELEEFRRKAKRELKALKRKMSDLAKKRGTDSSGLQ